MGVKIAALLLLVSSGSLAAPFMGSANARDIYESIKWDCYDRARPYLASPAKHNAVYAHCIDDAFSDHDAGDARYSAVVYGYQPDGSAVYGFSWTDSTLAIAVRNAYETCRERNAEGCILRYFVRNGCLALAVGHVRQGFGFGADRSDAERNALLKCTEESCVIVQSHCNHTSLPLDLK